MKEAAGLLVTICVLLIVTVNAQYHAEYTVGTVCTGVGSRESKSGSDLDYYYHIKRLYEGCTYILQNVDIHPMESLEQNDSLSLDFLGSIKEVNGYVRIRGQVPKSMKKLPFTNLTIIRGQFLIGRGDETTDQYSLFIYNIRSITSLGLNSLREISRGNVFIQFNALNCYGVNTNWADIFQMPDKQRADVKPGLSCGFGRCHDSCPQHVSSDSTVKKYCWGPTAGDCQELSKETCAPQCEYRCSGIAVNECCHSQCLAGCSGPTENDCWGCRNFYNNGTCVSRCPRSEIYNSTTFQNEKNPNAKVSYGKLCLKRCPAGYVEFNEGCYRACPKDTQQKDGKCVDCDGPCPQRCNWDGLYSDWLTDKQLDDPRFQHCTAIDGDVPLVSASFDDYTHPSDPYQSTKAVTLDQLRVFETVQEITGTLTVEPGDRLPAMTSLSMFKNLRKVGGVTAKGWTISIISSHITSLGLNSLEQVSSGAVYILAPKLCYTSDPDLYSNILTGSSGKVRIEPPVDFSRCAAMNMSCNKECAATCVGPDDSECLGCLEPTDKCPGKCSQYEFEGRCLSDCSSEPGLYNASLNTCGRCHEQCSGGCTGPSEAKCTACKNYKNQIYCVAECPLGTYTDELQNCQPCNENCKLEDFSCKGPAGTISDKGCSACDLVMLSNGVAQCMNSSLSCPAEYLETRQTLTVQNITLSAKIANRKCIECQGECATCNSVPTFCTSCKNFEWPEDPDLVNQSPDYALSIKQKRCVGSCDKNLYPDNERKICLPCDESCRGCIGPTARDCIKCSGFRVPLNGSDTEFECVDKCPARLPDGDIDPESSEKICIFKQPNDRDSQNGTGTVTAGRGDSGALIGGLLAGAVIVILVVIFFYLLYRRRRITIQRAEDYEKRNELALVPMSPTAAEPDLSRLRLISEKELKKTVIIGSGAFGTVFKGFFIPDGEKVMIPVAIKVLIEGNSPAQNTELLDEARVMASVDHPCCIRILAVCMTAQMMLVTPLMPDGSLLSYIRANTGRLGSKVLINWCAQIARGMSHLQKCGIVHRDLAARNVLVASQYQVKITDFGLAKLLDAGEEYYLAESGKLPIKWMALESIQHRIFDHMTDVWSYGVTIWEVLTFGEKPYPAVKARDVSMLLERGERLPQPNISTIDVYMILIKCWMLDANARPTFDDLDAEFTKMARDPGRYLVIDGDQLKRAPNSLKITSDSVTNSVFSDINMDDEYPDKELVAADDYLSPSISSARYENEEAFSGLTVDKTSPDGGSDDLHSPLRYTSSPTLAPGLEDNPLPQKPVVDMAAVEEYLEPNTSRQQSGKAPPAYRTPSVDDDGYLQPNSSTGYIGLPHSGCNDGVGVAKRRAYHDDQAPNCHESAVPLLAAENSDYLSPTDPSSYSKPTQQSDSHVNSKSNPTYVSNNNGSPKNKQAPPRSKYQNLDYVNQS